MTADFKAGTNIGGYVLDSYIGGGSFGAVWRGHDEKSGDTVAVKLLTGALSSSETAAMRADVELLAASAASRSDHVVHVLGGGVEPVPHIVMEYVEGNDLAALLKDQGKLSAEDTINVGVAISDALSALNEAGIIHRDIKPANVMMMTEGKIKLADFGIAKIVGYETMTMTGQAAMTMAYAAPEIWDDGSPFGKPSHKSDLYAMGVLLYQCLTGETPFRGNYGALYKAHTERSPDIKALPLETPPSLRTLVQRCLEKRQEDRPRDASDCIAMLQRARAEVTGRAGASNEPKQFGPWVKEAPHESQPWAWYCHHESKDQRAIVEVHFADSLDYGANLRRALGANPKLVPLGAERIFETNRLLLHPNESWMDPPTGRFQFWVAREEKDIQPATVVTTAALAAAVPAIAALNGAAASENISISPSDQMEVMANGSIYLRRAGLDTTPRDLEQDAWEFIRKLPLDSEARALVSASTSFAGLASRLTPAAPDGATVVTGRGDATVFMRPDAGDTVFVARDADPTVVTGSRQPPAPAGINCPNCNTPVIAGQAFCGNCGASTVAGATGAAALPPRPAAAAAAGMAVPVRLQMVRSSVSGAAAWYEITVSNPGTLTANLRLSAVEQGDRLAFALPEQVRVQPGASERVRLHVQSRSRRMFGGKKTIPFSVFATGGGAGSPPPSTVNGEFEDYSSKMPLFAGVGVLGIAAVAAVGAMAMAGGDDSGNNNRLGFTSVTATAVVDSTSTPVPQVVAPPTPTPEPPPPPPPVIEQPPPPPPPEPNRANCNAIRGTAYQSPTEEAWWNANCVGQTVAPPPPTSTRPPTTNPGGGGGGTTPPPPPPPPTSTPRPATPTYTISASLDRTTYTRGQAFRLCYRLNPQGTPFTVRLYESINGVNQGLQAEWQDTGTLNGSWNDCVGNLAWDNVPGNRVLRIEAIVNGVSVSANISASVQ